MGSAENTIALGQKIYIGKAEALAIAQTPEFTPRKRISKVAEAEANHLIVGDAIGIGASEAVVGENSGHVLPDKFHPTMAMAHRHGNSHDTHLTIAMGYSPEPHAKAAEAIIARDIETRDDLAVALDSERSMGRTRIERVIFDSRKRQEEQKTPKAILFITTSDRRRVKLENLKVENGSVVLPDNIIALTVPDSETVAQRKEKDELYRMHALEMVRGELASLV